MKDEARVFGECDFLASGYTAAVEGDRGAVGSDAGCDLRGASGQSDDIASEAEAVGADEIFTRKTIRGVIAILIQRASGEECEDERDDDLVLRLGFDVAFGVHGQLARGGGVCASEGCLDVFRLAAGEDDLFEVEAENSGASEGAGMLGLSDCADDGCTLRYGDGVVGVIDGLGDDGVDDLTGFGGG